MCQDTRRLEGAERLAVGADRERSQAERRARLVDEGDGLRDAALLRHKAAQVRRAVVHLQRDGRLEEAERLAVGADRERGLAEQGLHGRRQELVRRAQTGGGVRLAPLHHVTQAEVDDLIVVYMSIRYRAYMAPVRGVG